MVESQMLKKNPSHVYEIPYRREDFAKWLKNADTIVDTLFIFGPNNQDKLAQYAEDIALDSTRMA